MKKLFSYMLLAAIVLTGCSRNDNDDFEPYNHRNGRDYTIHQFVWETCFDLYYWNENVPSRLDVTKFGTPYELFESFRHKDDRFSVVVNNYSEVNSLFNNEYRTDGLDLEIYRDRYHENGVVAMVNYVYENSPAAEAGITRGCVIKAVNGTTLNKNNYAALLDQNGYTLTYSKVQLVDGKLEYNGEETTSPYITKRDMDINSVLKVSTHQVNSHNIGYFLYDSFDDDTVSVKKAMAQLAAENVTDLVIDLRLNGGGYVNTLTCLASMLVPKANEGDVFIYEDMNQNLTTYYKQQGIPTFSTFTEQETHLNIDKLYVITSHNTASASEELISGLSPYMDVTIIGDTTYGKFTSNILLNDEDDHGTDDDGIDYSEWAVYLVIACCKNAKGEMDFKEGFVPDYYIKDTYNGELGSEDEELFAKAISLIANGGQPVIAKRGQKTPELNLERIGSKGKPDIANNLIISRR
ncbi:MAG: hypothetical protein J5882_01730 [Bacteroidales bacterium]|nr:hypothetical protein [Bacteroidales bacterium]